MTQDRLPTIPVVEERARVETRRRVTRRVRVRTETDTTDSIAEARLEGETVEITRVPRGVEVAAPPDIRTEGDVTVIPVCEEMLFVERRLVLTEEIHVRRRRTRETVAVPVALRRQRAIVEELDPEPTDIPTSDQREDDR
jgi:stress response protein YsnF